MSEVIIPNTREKIFQEEHKEWMILYNRRKSAKWYQEHKEERKEYDKEYREENKAKLIEKGKKYYAQNKAKILEKAAAKVTCDVCGSIVCRRRMTDHKRTTQCKAIQEKRALETHAEIIE